MTAAVLCLLSCSTDEQGVTPIPQTVVGDIPVRLGYGLSEDAPAAAGTKGTRASVVGGQEDPTPDYVKQLWMLCFTNDGIYLGYRQATLRGAEQALPDVHYDTSGNITGSTDKGCWGRYLFEGSVPARTSRIHFVANISEQRLPDNGQIGGNENTIIKSARLSVSTADQRITYWGFHGEESPEALRNWLAVTETTVNANGETEITGYSKKEGSIVHLIRDRARLTMNSMNDYNGYTDANGNVHQVNYKILSIDWILTNGIDHGYIAPYNENNPADHFAGYYNPQATPALTADRLTEYTAANAARYAARESDMVRVFTADETPQVKEDATLYLFEETNQRTDRPKIILRVQYQKDLTKAATGTNLVTKYHTLMLMNNKNEAAPIFRNHEYKLRIEGLPWEGLGYSTFSDAVNSTEYANNRTVTIDEKVPSVNNGKYMLTITSGTYQVYQQPALAGTTQTVTFTYEATDGTSTLDGIDASNFTARWVETPRASFAAPEVRVASFTKQGQRGTGTLQFTLGTTINEALQSGQIQLHDEHGGLSRFVNVYTITQFSLLPTGLTQLRLTDTGNVRLVAGQACHTYRLDIVIPREFPIGLYPLTLYMTSTTLNPYQMDVDGATDSNASFGVVMQSTENGASMAGETLSGMRFADTPVTAWNYRQAGSSWNYWYTYTMATKPQGDTDHQLTIYFDDTRPLRANDNRASQVGLFFWMKYFGSAMAVTSE